MEIRFERPPLWAEINAKFKVQGKPVIFSWGNIIYNPERIVVSPELVIHEHVHGQRQAPGIVEWWQHYIQNEEFRYAEELLAHKAEFAFLAVGVKDRNVRNKLLVRTAGRLTSPLYGWSRPIYDATQALKR